MEQSNEQPIESVQSSKNIWITVVAVIIATLIVGGGVYAWQRSNLKNTEHNLEQQISVLQNQISQLQQVQANQNQQTNQPAIEQQNNVQTTTNNKLSDVSTIDAVTNWKTYRNMKYGYEIKYPDSWQYQDDVSIAPPDALGTVFAEQPLITTPSLNIYVGERSDVGCTTGPDSEYLSVKNINIAEYNAIQYTLKKEFDVIMGYPVFTILKTAQHCVIFNGKYNRITKDSFIDIQKKMFSTFQFIKQDSDENVSEVETNKTTTPVETISETTYQNDKYGFSFKYDPEKYSVAESRSRGGATGDESDLIRMITIGESCPAVDIFVSTATLEQELNDLEFKISGDTVQTTVDGISVTKRSGDITENLPPCGSEKTEVVFEHEGSVFVITAFKNWESSLDELLESIDF